MISRRFKPMSSEGWVCPRCNNGDDHLNMAQEIKNFIKFLDKFTTVHRTGEVWCIDRKCMKCHNRWTFKSNWTCVENITDENTFGIVGSETHNLPEDTSI